MGKEITPRKVQRSCRWRKELPGNRSCPLDCYLRKKEWYTNKVSRVAQSSIHRQKQYWHWQKPVYLHIQGRRETKQKIRNRAYYLTEKSPFGLHQKPGHHPSAPHHRDARSRSPCLDLKEGSPSRENQAISVSRQVLGGKPTLWRWEGVDQKEIAEQFRPIPAFTPIMNEVVALPETAVSACSAGNRRCTLVGTWMVGKELFSARQVLGRR